MRFISLLILSSLFSVTSFANYGHTKQKMEAKGKKAEESVYQIDKHIQKQEFKSNKKHTHQKKNKK